MFRPLTTTAALVAAGLIATPAGFAQSSPPHQAGQQAAGSTAKETLSQEDRTFLKEAAIGGMAEVQLSKVAQKSQNADVKSFADRMVRDHTAANEQLTAVAAGLGAELPKALDTEHEKMRERLQTLHGKAFDEQYMQVMVEDHEKAVKLFQQEGRVGHSVELKQFAQKTLPTLEEHQKMALQLSHKLSQTAAK